MFRHDAMITTLRRHLWHLTWLIWERETSLLESNSSWHLKETLKHWFGGGRLPYYSCRSTGAPLPCFKERYNAPQALPEERCSSWERWHFPKAYQGVLQRSNALSEGALPILGQLLTRWGEWGKDHSRLGGSCAQILVFIKRSLI